MGIIIIILILISLFIINKKEFFLKNCISDSGCNTGKYCLDEYDINKCVINKCSNPEGELGSYLRRVSKQTNKGTYCYKCTMSTINNLSNTKLLNNELNNNYSTQDYNYKPQWLEASESDCNKIKCYIEDLNSDKICKRQNCEMSEWSNWSECSSTCGPGTQTRNRTIKSPSAYGGMPCGNLKEQRECNSIACYLKTYKNAYLQVWRHRFEKNKLIDGEYHFPLSLMWLDPIDIKNSKLTKVYYELRKYKYDSPELFNEGEFEDWSKSERKLADKPDDNLFKDYKSNKYKGYNYAIAWAKVNKETDEKKYIYDIRIFTEYSNRDTYVIYPLFENIKIRFYKKNSDKNLLTFEENYLNSTYIRDYSIPCSTGYYVYDNSSKEYKQRIHLSGKPCPTRPFYDGIWWSYHSDFYGLIIPSYISVMKFDDNTYHWSAIAFMTSGNDIISKTSKCLTTKTIPIIPGNTDYEIINKDTWRDEWGDNHRNKCSLSSKIINDSPSFDEDLYYTNSNNNENISFRIGIKPSQLFNNGLGQENSKRWYIDYGKLKLKSLDNK